MIKDNGENKLRVNPIQYSIKSEGGEDVYVYKLPEVRVLPTNPLYIFKKIRDYFWVGFSHNPEEKAEVLLLLADKKMAETMVLEKKNNFKAALDTSEEALDKLKYADRTISRAKNKDIKMRELEKQIIRAGNAYKFILTDNKENNFNETKYQKIIKELEEWLDKKEF